MMEASYDQHSLDLLRGYYDRIRSASPNFPIYKDTFQQLVLVSGEYALDATAQREGIHFDASILEWYASFCDWIQSKASADLVAVLPQSEAVKLELKDYFEQCPVAVRQHTSIPLLFQPSYDEILDSLRDVMSSRESVRIWTNLKGAEARAVIELLDAILDKLSAQDRLWRPCIDVTRKLCGKLKFFPASFSLPPGSVTMLSNRPLGSGGFADVYKGQRNGNEVALKVIRIQDRESSDARHAKMFTQEAVIWKRLQHPNIVPFHGVDVTLFPSQTTLVSDWMPRGRLVGEYLHRNPSANRLRLLLDVTEGLAYLHGLDIVHGDLKSMNILVDRQHVARISDFGLTYLNYQSQVVSRSAGVDIGTVRWSSPELIDPQQFGLDDTGPTRPSDIYALSMVMWEIFTGELPFAECARDATVINRILREERPVRPDAQTAPHLSGEIWSLMERCWEQDWKARPDAPMIVIAVQRMLEF
ncbi:hypothetical protein CERSUDRAFT_109903 [Gelatoporia subvermispora B]|uniref:Protein kinase domain-containing protein n=1 Tax=Ceriporiopsis subvermispora (strain B) TaxID=914234 RepID=M2QW33_CERS8|nr:hypothetical protein CERSUDRAFT_109903 [Gelatoporia subvermispora B]